MYPDSDCTQSSANGPAPLCKGNECDRNGSEEVEVKVKDTDHSLPGAE